MFVCTLALVNVSFLPLASKVEPRNQRLAKFRLNRLPGDLSVLWLLIIIVTCMHYSQPDEIRSRQGFF